MKKLSLYILVATLAGMLGCKKDNYPGGKVSPYISIFDIRDLYRGTDVTLTNQNMFGSEQITGIVTSDHSGNNLPDDLLIMQDSRRLSQPRGIAIALADAETYQPGDSLIINVAGGVLKKVNGILQITGIENADITKVSTGNPVYPLLVKSNAVIANPASYESTLISIVRVGFDASYPPGTTYAGNKTINDGFGNMTLHTEADAAFANKPIPFLSNFTGIVFSDENNPPQLWPRIEADITILSATAPKISPIVITGYLVDPTGTDANYEYIQLMATKNINFATNNFSIVTTNNAGTSTPTGFPASGWATGGLRTYKINITSGSVTKGQYFYVGANKNIWGAGSTDISSAFWVSKLYASEGGDGFGSATTNLLANSGNAGGIAIFDLTNVTNDTIPVDVIFYGGGGSLYTPGPPEKGYKITNTDYYDIVNPSNQQSQPYFNQGSNTGKLAFPAATNFTKMGGVYNITTGRWTTARTLTSLPLTSTSTRTEIEGATTLEQ
jgi:hypothetical protein